MPAATDVRSRQGAETTAGTSISVHGLSRVYPDGTGLHPTDLDVDAGEFLSVLGPSGCGKSTLLRCLAGLDEPHSGTIAFGDDLVCDVGRGVTTPPRRRRIGMVFQDLALWPHMTAEQNVAFPLRVSRTPRREARSRAMTALERVGLTQSADKYPHQLSGGQQQRVAIARAIVFAPRLLLMDEPLSALDAALRRQLRAELRALTTDLGLTAVYVTHDQAEAMSMSDRIAVLSDGHVRQVSRPEELYAHPSDDFVAGFIGTLNLLPRADIGLGVRPEHVTVIESADLRPDHVVFEATVLATAYLGGSFETSCAVTDVREPWTVPDHRRRTPGDVIRVAVDPARVLAPPPRKESR